MGAFSLPTSGPAQGGLRNPILDELDRAAQDAHARLSPGAQEALRQSGAPIPSAALSPRIVSPSAMPPPLTMDRTPLGPSELPGPTSGSLTPPSSSAPALGTPAPAPLSPATQHLQDIQSRGTGISRIHNPILRTLATIGDVAAGTFSPRAEMLIPGTEGHHQLELDRAQEALGEEQKATSLPIENRLHAAQATEAESLPALHQAQTELGQSKANETARANQATEDIKRTQNETADEIKRTQNEATTQHQKDQLNATLRQHGFKVDDKGNLIPVPYEEMSQEQQAVHDLKSAQSEQADAAAALKKAQAENQPQMVALQQTRLASAQQAHEIAMRRLGLSEATYNARYLGQGKNGEALPGALLTEEGKAVGTTNAANVRPTAVQRNRAELGTSAQEQLEDLRSIVQKRPDIFGPLAGRKTDFTKWIGSEDPDAQRFATARTILGHHEAGTFGGTSTQTVKDLESAAGLFKDNPDAILAGLGQLQKANKVFIHTGTPRTVGSNAAAAEPVVSPPSGPVDPKVKAYADQFFGGDTKKAQAAIDQQRSKK